MNWLSEVLLLESIGKRQFLIVLFLPVWQLDSCNGWLLENDVLTRIIPPLPWLCRFTTFLCFALLFCRRAVWRAYVSWWGHFALWARHLYELIDIGIILCLGEDIHSLSIKFLHAPSEIEDVECVSDTNSEPFRREIEPVSVTFRVRVYFQNQVVFFTIVDVRRVKIATFKVLVKTENVLLVDKLRQIRFQVFVHIVQDVLRSCFLIVNVTIY